jgi:hypothetical protein
VAVAQARRAFSWQLGDLRSWLITAAAGIAAYAASSHGLVIWAGRWQLPLFVGCVVGLVSLIPWQGALVALVAVVGGMLVAPPELLFGAQVGTAGYLLALVIAPLAGAAPSVLRSLVSASTRKRLNLAMSAAMVLWTLANFWFPLVVGGLPPQGYGPLQASAMRAELRPGTYSDDANLYRRVFELMHSGDSYYPAFRSAWLGLSSRTALPNSAFGVRLPTYFWLWPLLPSDPFSIVYLWLVFASVGIVASALIAGQLVGPRLAPLAALAVSAFALDVGFSTYVVFVDLPAAAVALVGVALLLWSARTRRMRPLWAAVAVLTLAALTREILAYLLVFGAASALLEVAEERLRRAIPWLVGLVGFAVGYGAHIVASRPYIDPTSTSVSYFNGGIAFLTGAFGLFANSLGGGAIAMAVLVALGLAGAVVSRRRAGAPFAAFAFAAALMPFVAMLFVGNEGFNASHTVQLNYWGILVIPLALSMWPASALLLVRKRE